MDVKASFDTYHNCMTAVCDQKTLIITNPGKFHSQIHAEDNVLSFDLSLDCSEAYQLYQFSQSVEIGPDSSDLSSEADTTLGNDISTIIYSREPPRYRKIL